jgi:hypothetical protein
MSITSFVMAFFPLISSAGKEKLQSSLLVKQPVFTPVGKGYTSSIPGIV